LHFKIHFRYVKVGDTIHQFDPVCEVQSDKATVTITSRYDGTIRALHFEPQDMCAVGQALVDIELAEGASDTPSPAEPAHASPTTVEARTPEPDHTSHSEAFGKALATPAVRRLAVENKVGVPSFGDLNYCVSNSLNQVHFKNVNFLG
uniref:Lipoamide acyltransferase component of branched-chain alpha-keto acid dehydrogenase complex, mitochondrial n=1 Tax=Echinostoma caproni TaxID=27848 RepID=A0A183A064_9TREM